MNKQPIVDSLNKKIKQIDPKYKVVDENGGLSLKVDFSDWDICEFSDWNKENFKSNLSSFWGVLDELIVDGHYTDTRLLVAQTFYKEGYRLLEELDND